MADDNENVEDAWAEALEEQIGGDNGSEVAAGDDDSSVAMARFENLQEGDNPGGEVDLEMILDIPVTLSVEIGRTKINISNLLKLNQGSVVELDRIAGEPMDVVVNGTLIAHGEIVVVNEKFGIRLTDVLSASERIKSL